MFLNLTYYYKGASSNHNRFCYKIGYNKIYFADIPQVINMSDPRIAKNIQIKHIISKLKILCFANMFEKLNE